MGELQGHELGGYRLLNEIGSGGVAEVYHARQMSGGGRDVVVKVIFKEFARQPGFARNIAYVTEASARLASHPHILPLVTYGEENEYIYLVTPYVKEGTLADWLNKGGRLGAADVGPFFQQLCGALSYAHSLGVVHGNLKPSNIYLHEGRHILLGDFGLLWDVRALDPSWSGSGVEAFEYLAPEVFGGQITQAGDIYSLGATLFHSLAGHTPFHANKLAELIAAAQQQQPPSLGRQQPPLAPAIAALDPVVAQAMAKRPEDRFASAVLLAQSIEGALRQAVAQGAPVTPAGQPQWQPYASTPVSAGVFNLAGQQPQPPEQPHAVGGFDGLIPLTQLETPFPPLPASALVDESMEQGGVALSGNLPFNPAASHVLDPPTMRIPAPQGNGHAYGDMPNNAALSYTQAQDGQPITAPRMGPSETFAASDLMPLDTADPQDAEMSFSSQRLPAVQVNVTDDGAQSGQFSPTDLGLPRLTNPALTNLPQAWQDLLTDESAQRRHDPFAESQGALLPMLPPSLADDSVEMYAQSGSDMRHERWDGSESNRRSERWDDSEPGHQRAWAASMDSANSPARGRARDNYASEASNDRSDRRELDDNFQPSLADQRIWTNSQTIIKIGKRLSATPFVFLILALMILTELAGFAVTRPDLCVTHACAVVAGEVEKYVPNLRIPGAPAPVTFTPNTLKITAATNGAEKITVTLTNKGGSPVNWSASTTLGWLTVSPASGSLAKGAHTQLTLTSRPSGVTPGSYTAGLVVDAATGQSTAAVALVVTPGPVIAVTPPTLDFSACGVSQPLTVANTGGGKLTFAASPSQSAALSVTPSSGIVAQGAKATVSVTLSCSATAGQSYAVIIVSNGGSAQTAVKYH